jgi:hypothetical protein
MDQEQQRYDRAHARVQALKGFYIHASAYVLVNIALFVINVLVGGGWWFYWPLLGWGIGLGVHALAVFGFSGGGPQPARLANSSETSSSVRPFVSGTLLKTNMIPRRAKNP